MKIYDSHIRRVFALFLCLTLAFCFSLAVRAADGFQYEHDPRLNPSAMADVVEDENAVYGFRPSETGSLKMYASYDWTDPELVAQARAERSAYHKSLESMYTIFDEMTKAGKTTEEIARTLSAKRNELRLAAYENDPEGLAELKQRNFEKFGHEEGPLPDELYLQYGSWETVLLKAFSTNSGMDACVGLYDDYYDLYVAAGQIPGEQPPTGTAVSLFCALLLFSTGVALCIAVRMKSRRTPV